MTPEETAAAVKGTVLTLGGAWMLDGATRARAREVGLRSRPSYYCGRGGVLGDVPAEVVAATFAFFPFPVLRDAWEAGRAVMAPAQASAHYAQFCADWGRDHYAAVADAGRLADLVARVVDGAEPAGLPLFAGWRAMPRPADDAGRLNLLLHVLREHRGAVHVAAVAAIGLDPLGAVVAGPYQDNAKFFEWPEPYPDPEPYRAAWAKAEELTAAGAAPAFGALTVDERIELVALLESLSARMS